MTDDGLVEELYEEVDCGEWTYPRARDEFPVTVKRVVVSIHFHERSAPFELRLTEFRFEVC